MEAAPPSLAFRLALAGREEDARNVELTATDALSPHVWDFLRKLKVDRESFVLYDATRGRRLDPDWPCDQAGLQPGALVMVGDQADFPDPLADYRAVLARIKTERAWPISEETGHELLERRHELAVTRLEHGSMAREAGLPPDDSAVLWDWRRLEERRREEYGILLNLARSKPAVPEGAMKKLAELRAAMALAPEEHMDMCARLGMDSGLAARLLQSAAPVPQGHLDYVAALSRARAAEFSTGSLETLRDLVVQQRLTRDVHLKLAAQALIAPELADACFEDKEGLAVGRNFYRRELMAASKRTASTADELSRLKSLREKYGIRRPEHMRIAREWGVQERAAEALWDLKAPPRGLSGRGLAAGAAALLAVILATPPGQHAMRMMWRGVVDSFQPPSQFDADGFDARGFDRTGYDRRGLDQSGYDRTGFDIQGFGKDGFDRNGFDRAGLDRKGRDREGYDKDGFDVRGLDRKGLDRTGRDREGYDAGGFKDGYDRAGFNALGLDRQGFNRQGRDKDGFDKTDRDAAGYDRKGFDKTGRDRKGFDREGRDAEGYDRDGFDTTGFNRDGYDREGYDRNGYDKQGYDRGGFDRRGLDRMGNPRPRGGSRSPSPGAGPTASPGAEGTFGADGYGPDGFDRFGRDRKGFDRNGYGKDGFNFQGRNRGGFDRNGRDPQGFDRDGLDAAGFDREGRDRRGFSREGHDRDGFDRGGFNRQGFDREGRSRDGTDLLPGPLATLQGESASGWMLRGPGGAAYRTGNVVPPYGVKLERVGGNVVHFRHDGVLYERKIFK